MPELHVERDKPRVLYLAALPEKADRTFLLSIALEG
jgi:hypothetical protein